MYLIKNAKILDAQTEYASFDILVEGERIVSASRELTAPENCEIIDLQGCTLLPAFVDAHVHAPIPERESVAFRDDIMTKLAKTGICLCKDDGLLTSHPLEPYMEFLKACDDPYHTKVVTAGRYIDVNDGYGMGPDPVMKWGIEITTPNEAAEAVSYQAAAGVDGIKIGISGRGPEMTEEMILAVTDRARELGLWTTAHVSAAKDLQKLVNCGIGEAAHTPPDHMSEELILQMVKDGISMITTVGERPSKVSEMDRHMHHGQTDEEILASKTERYEGMLDNLKRFYEAGGSIAIGTDLMMSDEKARIPIDELQALRSIGIPMEEVIRCGTVGAAQVCGISDIGLVREGMMADLIAIRGELDDDFTKLDPPMFVMNRGVILRDDR